MRSLLPALVAALAAPAVAQPTAAVAPGGAASRDRAAAVTTLAESLATARLAEGVPGVAIGVFHAGRPVLLRSWGVADVAAQRPLATDPVMDIASITKQFTAAGVLALVDDGRLSLDDPVTRHLPALGDGFATVTVRHLLTHTSGIGRYEAAFPGRAPADADTVLAVIRAAPREGAPGGPVQYNNANYVLLGRVIEAVARQPWDRFLAERVVARAGLTRTGTCPASREGLPTGYMGGAQRTARPPVPALLTAAAGAFCSSPGELARWSAALHGGQVLSPASYALLVTPSRGASGYAMGTVTDEVGGHRRHWHNGALTSGFNGVVQHYPADSLTVVVLANHYPARPEALGEALARSWLGLPPAAERTGPVVSTAPAIPLAAYAGTYRTGPLTFVVAVEGDRVTMTDPAGRALPLKAVEPHHFTVVPDPSFHVLFDIEQGAAVRLRIDSPRAKAPPAVRVP